MEIFQWWIVFALVVLNPFGLFLVWFDKQRSLSGRDGRVPEVYFFLTAVFFASLGIFLGLFAFRHKTRKTYFPLGLGFLCLEQCLLVWFLLLH